MAKMTFLGKQHLSEVTRRADLGPIQTPEDSLASHSVGGPSLKTECEFTVRNTAATEVTRSVHTLAEFFPAGPHGTKWHHQKANGWYLLCPKHCSKHLHVLSHLNLRII